MKTEATDWETVFEKHIYDKEFVSEIHIFKNLLKLNSKKTNNLIEKWATI